MANPFTPNFGQVPLCMAGRDQLISEIVNGFENAPGDPSLTSILVGARGTGKTAALSLLANEAEQRGWIAISVSCVEGMLEEIFQLSVRAATQFADKHSTRRLKGISIGQLIGVEWETVGDERPTWRIRMSDVIDQLEENGVGLLITVDEVTPKLGEMIQLASIYQHFIREERKVSLLMAGLPSEVTALLTDKAVSFLRRASRYDLGRIEDYEIEQAFRKTIEQSGKKITSGALGLAVKETHGFPFMMQLVGYRAWAEAENDEIIGKDAVSRGSRLARKDMETRVLRSTLDELSAGDLAFLEAMLHDERYSTTSNIEERLGKTANTVSQYRARLIAQGVIEPHGRGKVAFSLPLLREYLPEYLSMR